MVIKSPRELLQLPSSWSIPQIMQALSLALSGEGPALAFGPSQFHTVDSEVAVVIPTSGSTGAPKEVALTAPSLLASASASHLFLQAQPEDRWSLLLPTNHVAGVNVLVRAIALGSEIATSDFDFTSIVPTQLFRAVKEKNELFARLQSAKAVLVGGAATGEDLLTQARAEGINVVTSYGMSEMSGGCVYDGTPLVGVEVDIRGDGRIALRGAMQAKEYLGSSLPLADSLGWFLTSDSGRYEDGKLFITGRIDDQIISGGENISLSAIDDFLNERLSGDFMSCALPHVEWGQQLCLASSMKFDQAQIALLLRSRFGNHAVAKLFLAEIELPHTAIGKPDRQALAKKFEMMLP